MSIFVGGASVRFWGDASTGRADGAALRRVVGGRGECTGSNWHCRSSNVGAYRDASQASAR